MEGILSLIDTIIEEHKHIAEDASALEQRANDLSSLLALDRATRDFEPASLDRSKRSLQGLRESLERIDRALRAHFDREESALLRAFEEHGGATFAAALRSLLFEHQELKSRIDKVNLDIAQLISGGLYGGVWEGMAYGLRAYINNTRRLLEAHAQSEQELLQRLRKELIAEQS